MRLRWHSGASRRLTQPSAVHYTPGPAANLLEQSFVATVGRRAKRRPVERVTLITAGLYVPRGGPAAVAGPDEWTRYLPGNPGKLLVHRRRRVGFLRLLTRQRDQMIAMHGRLGDFCAPVGCCHCDVFLSLRGIPLRRCQRTLRNAAVDQFRRRGAADRAYGVFARELETHEAQTGEREAEICACVSRLAATLKPEYAEALQAIEVTGTPVKAYRRAKGPIVEQRGSARVPRPGSAEEASHRVVRHVCGARVCRLHLQARLTAPPRVPSLSRRSAHCPLEC